ncbi:MAG TPA: Gfo/Idh/MocA family oxidoreductase [Fimbriimonadales bacterium]|nr:Gfo/Idh/MocA family oxidoreductase [Fimbriimonadales bacterium]
MDPLQWKIPEEELAPKLPKNSDYGIGILGCGEIVNLAHLPAYRAAGLNVVACYDLREEAAKRTAEKFNIPNVCRTLDELLEREDVRIVDIAFHIEGRKEAIEKAAKAKKHILVQKPIANTLQDAEHMIAIAEKHNVKIQANQQARWAGVYLLLKKWVQNGAIGSLNFIHFDVRGWQDDPQTWYVKMPNFTLCDHGIHYFDLVLYFADKEPQKIAAMQTAFPGQVSVAPMLYGALIFFEEGLMVCHTFHNKVEIPNPWEFRVVLDGDEGAIFCDGSKGILRRKDGTFIEQEPKSRWFPDAFLGPMADLMDAIEEDREPACSGRSNLRTLRLVLSALESAEKNTVVFL